MVAKVTPVVIGVWSHPLSEHDVTVITAEETPSNVGMTSDSAALEVELLYSGNSKAFAVENTVVAPRRIFENFIS